jgi:hypothetical protein
MFLLLVSLLFAGCTQTVDDGTDTDGGTDNGSGGSTTLRQTFGVIGDYGDDDDNSRAVADLIKGWDPDFIITTGDNDYSDGAFRGTFEGLELGVGQYFHEYIGNYQGSEGPGSEVNRFFPTPGDHDWGDTCDDPDGLDDYLRYFTLPDDNSGNERYYDFRRGDVHFFAVHGLLDCEVDGATADSVQAQWVRDAALASDARFKVAYCHRPPYSSGDRHVGEGAHMRWPWGDWGFDIVLSGDDHVYERIELDGVIYIVNGIGGVDLHGFVDTPVEGSLVRFVDNYGAMRFDVYDDRLEAQCITVDSTVVDEFTIVASGETNGSIDPVAQGDWYRPGVETTWQWQLQPDADGRINTSYDVDVYDLDLFNTDAAVIRQLQDDGRHVICYFSAGTYEDFRDDADEFEPAELGNTLDDFGDERWLDIRSSNVERIMLDRLDRAAEKGCDGVEPDNVDGFSNDSGFNLTEGDQLAFNQFIADEAHQRGLAVGLKNDLAQVPDLVDFFDFSVNEQCHEFDECDDLTPFIVAGKPVFNAEYDDMFVNDADARADLCADALNAEFRTLVLPVDLDDAFRFTCDP